MKTNDQFGGWNLLPKGFSLLEIVVVVAIIALLSAVTFGVIDGVKRKNQQARVIADLHLIRNALGDYKVQFGNYPLAKTGDSIQRQRILL
ncbi:MAG: prepilin-type N-terminal cleavage/methylation domain-containing protein, partial [Opitutales bacterium]|nr:prepilin-type N-terminal cleavage/methylation domain-containing protein [Opitutales bacterium]